MLTMATEATSQASSLELTPSGGTPLSKIFSMCRGGSNEEDDEENDALDEWQKGRSQKTTPATTSRSLDPLAGIDQVPLLGASPPSPARTISSCSDTCGSEEEQHADIMVDAANSSSTSSWSVWGGMDIGLLLQVAICMAVLAYEYQQMMQRVPEDESN